MMRFRACGVLLFSLALAGGVCAQQSTQEDSLAAAARQARDQKKQQAKPAKVWDNDNIPRNPGELTVLGSSSQSADESGDTKPAVPGGDDKTAAPPAKDSGAPSAEKKAALLENIAAAKESLQNLQNDLDIMQRKFVLDQQTHYSKPDFANTDKAGTAVLTDEQSQIDAKQEEMGLAQQKVADLQAQLNALNEAKPPQK